MMGIYNEDIGNFPQSIASSGAWEGRQFVNESEYVHHLTDIEAREIGSALLNFKQLGLDGDAVCQENFPLPTLSQKLCRISTDVHEGKGFGLIRGLNTLELSTADLTIAYLGIQSYVANTRGRQDEKGNMLVHITSDNSTEFTRQHHRHSTSEISFHNEEAGDVISWLTRNTAASGGKCVLASAYTVYNILSKSHQDSLNILAQPIWVFVNQDVCPRPIFFYHNKRILINFGRVQLIGNAIHPRPPRLPPLSKQQLQALDDVENLARMVQLEIKTRPGDIHFVNNLFVLHRRESFQDSYESSERRHLVRMRLRDDTLRWDLPASLEKEWSHSFDEGPAKVWHIEPMPSGFFPLRSYAN
ncbi:hypothetical protein FPOA_12524 [Fusarium poae]|uniref:TauD/TfdA-like domain-containing protein n=2 Tax=Fusarium poae TaxID=36050 RepID=A0A1B8A8S8_FUSPO|nr:hypothetical protein FPOA_13846 [Fusarium poae]OBS16879.1 hypothetical protein FPOA_12524 [Fusarium poae]